MSRSIPLKLCGLSAVRARFRRDAGSIQRLYFDYATGRRIGVMCKALAAAKKIYRCVEPAELEKISGTVHHGGIVAIVFQDGPAPVAPGDPAAWARKREALLILDRIGNAHNLGAIARTAAFFGVPRIVIADDPASARPNDAAFRVAEGGLENVEVRLAPSLPALIRELASAGYEVLGASTHGERAGGKGRPEGHPRAPSGPVAIVLGNEEQGLSPDVSAACTRLVTIPGSGKVESLNVSAAAAVLIREFIR
ncbi:MAG: RNA methyltransferase [Opitutaceae bacterium]|jgi:TrmH RNA methyltransferase